MTTKSYMSTIGVLAMSVFLSAVILSSTSVSADDSVVDQINITVPVSCTLSGTGMNSHTAEIPNGTYQANIGTTTLHAFCNDANGFAIYAAGYTGNEIGGTNSNKLVGTAATNNATIVTGLATSTPTPDVSNWAMKLAIQSDSGNTTGTNAVTIDSDTEGTFSNYHTVPNEYKKVAHKNTATDMTASTGGVKLTTTYAAYISKTQPADTYTGQVIYTLVHPSTAPEPVSENQIGVIYDGNGLFFDQAGTKSTNKVVYEESCVDEYGYIGDEPAIVKTNNLNNDGTQNGPYSSQNDYYCDGGGCFNTDYVEFEGASKLKIIVRYGLSEYPYDGENTGGYNFDIYSENYGFSIHSNGYGDQVGTLMQVFDGYYVSFYAEIWGPTNPGYDYGVYIQVYPIYDEPTEGASYDVIQNVCSYVPKIGSYVQTNTWNGKWYVTNNGETTYLGDEDAVIDYLIQNRSSLRGTTTTIYAYNPYIIRYNGNGSTAGTMANFYTSLLTNTASSTADLMAYNFKKTGYGFAGWSADQNATVNSSSKIYGPNEKITGNELTFDANREATLYAVWAQSAGNLQSWSGCSNMQTGQVTALTDTRDNNVYTVGKLADGNCWMMENLRLDAVNSSDSTKAQGFGGVFSGLASSEDTFGGTAANSKYSTSNITGGDQAGRAYRFPRYNNNNTNIGGTNSSSVALVVSPGQWDATCDYNIDPDECRAQFVEGNNDHAQWYGYGNYYSWAAAMANTVVINTYSTSESANTSICPTGWKLPYGGSTGNGVASGGFSYLDVQLGGTGTDQIDNDGEEIVSNRWRSYPNNFVYSGHIESNTANGRGSLGLYWTSSSENSDFYAHGLRFSSDRVWTYDGDTKYRGFAVRCLTPGT